MGLKENLLVASSLSVSQPALAENPTPSVDSSRPSVVHEVTAGVPGKPDECTKLTFVGRHPVVRDSRVDDVVSGVYEDLSLALPQMLFDGLACPEGVTPNRELSFVVDFATPVEIGDQISVHSSLGQVSMPLVPKCNEDLNPYSQVYSYVSMTDADVAKMITWTAEKVARCVQKERPDLFSGVEE